MAASKTCFKCNTEKPLTEFYKHMQMGDGHLNKCKECTKRDVRLHRAANDSVREYDRMRALLPHRVESRRRIVSEWIEANPDRRAAHVKVRRAILRGELTRQPCEVCGAEPAEGHHPDYSQPLAVVWLCPRHHRQTHALVA